MQTEPMDRYMIGKLEEQELMNTDLDPWEEGAKGYGVPLDDEGEELEVYFRVVKRDGEKGEFVRYAPRVYQVCRGIDILAGWLRGQS